MAAVTKDLVLKPPAVVPNFRMLLGELGQHIVVQYELGEIAISITKGVGDLLRLDVGDVLGVRHRLDDSARSEGLVSNDGSDVIGPVRALDVLDHHVATV